MTVGDRVLLFGPFGRVLDDGTIEAARDGYVLVKWSRLRVYRWLREDAPNLRKWRK